MPSAHPALPDRSGRLARSRHWPHDALGWWAFGLLLATATSPAAVWGLWVVVRFPDPTAARRTAATVAITVPAVLLGAVALARPASRATAVAVLAGIVAAELGWATFWVTAFGGAALGAIVAGATTVTVAAGVALGRLIRRPGVE